jgi:regulator of protease activity HflC (stomatin/prohibitin superfamily)
VAVQFNVDATKIKESYYTLQSPKPQIESYIQDAVRSAVPVLTLDEAYERKDDIAKDVKETVAEGMAAYGYVINNVLITELTPDASVVKAMNSINAAQRMKDAAQQQAEADRIKTVTKATADAEAAKLQGEGIADQRKAIADGLAEQLSTLQKTGVDSREVIELLMMTQYFNTMENIGGDGKVVFMRGDAGGYQEAVQQLMASTGAKD